MNGWIAVALGGAIGASLRHGVGVAAARLAPAGWPWGTFTVNIVGSLLMGLAMGWLAVKSVHSESAAQTTRLFLATGILGGFTTFSAFSLEVANFIEEGAVGRAAGYAGASLVIGVAALFVGLWLSRRLFA